MESLTLPDDLASMNEPNVQRCTALHCTANDRERIMHSLRIVHFGAWLQAGVFLFASAASADFTGIYVESVASNTLENTTLDGMTYRIYAQFDDPDDRLLSAFDTNIDFLSVLYNDASFGTNAGPHSAAFDAFVPNLAADSHVALGNTAAGNGMNAGPEWDEADFASGAGITGGWAHLAPGAVPDENGRVLVLYLTFLGDDLPVVNGTITSLELDATYSSIALHELIWGSMRFAYVPAGNIAGTVHGVTVFFLIPAPGAIALLGLASLVPGQRRR